jgi:hypothetical protein
MDIDYIIAIIIFFVVLFFVARKEYFKPTGGRLKTMIGFFIATMFIGMKFCFFSCRWISYFKSYLNIGNSDSFTLALISHITISFLFGSIYYNKIVSKKNKKGAIKIIAMTLVVVYLTLIGILMI